MSNCQRYLEMMQQELDGQLSELEAKMLEKHVHQCPSCREEHATFQTLGSLLTGLEMEEAPFDLKDLIMAEVMQIDIQNSLLGDQSSLGNDQNSLETNHSSVITASCVEQINSVDDLQANQATLLKAPTNSRSEVDVQAEVSKKPKFFVSLLVALAAVNLVVFYYWLQPIIGVRVNTHGFVVFYQLVSNTFSKFVLVGRHTGDAFQIIARAIAGVIPWEWVIFYTILTGISVVGMLSMFRKRGGNAT